jgi:ABC-type multidrug transport system fused ATPase/permease subunit
MRKKFSEAMKGWRILWKYLSVYQRELTLLSVLGVFSALANGSVPYVMGKFLDAILKSHTVFEGTTFAMPFWALMLGAWGTIQIIGIITDWTNDRMARSISGELYATYLANSNAYLLWLPFSFHKDSKPGEINSAFNKAANNLETIALNIVIPLAPQFLSIIIGICFAFSMNISLASILLLGVLIYARFTKRGEKVGLRLGR